MLHIMQSNSQLGLVNRLGLVAWWPGGKALGWYAEGRRFDFALQLTYLYKNCDSWKLALHNY